MERHEGKVWLKPIRKQINPVASVDLLLRDLAEARDDDRYGGIQLATILGVALGVMLALAGFLYDTCAKGSMNCQVGPPGFTHSLTPIPTWLYVLAPVIPAALIAYAVLLSSVQALRSYYMRTIERRIHALTNQSFQELPFPSWSHVQLEVSGQMRAEPIAWVNWFMIYGTVVLMMIGCIFLTVTKIPLIRHRILALVFDGAIILVPVLLMIPSIENGSWLWHHALTGLSKRLERTDGGFPLRSRDNERPLWSFLLLPRIRCDDLLKSLLLPVGFGLGVFIVPGAPKPTADLLWSFVWFFFVFEFLVYQARYLWNDVRDRSVDCSGKLSKHRFPCSWTQPDRERFALRAAFVVFVTRLLFAVLLVTCVFANGNREQFFQLGALAAVLLIAVTYESARFKCESAVQSVRSGARGTTSGGQETESIGGREPSPGPSRSGRRIRARLWTYAVLGTVGLGYALRTFVGFWLAGVRINAMIVCAVGGAFFLGCTDVALAWALESTRAASRELAHGKAHLVLFRSFVSRVARQARRSVSPESIVLAGRQTYRAPWCITPLPAAVLLGLFALQIAVRFHGFSHPLILIGWTLLLTAGVVIASLSLARLLAVLQFGGTFLLLRNASVPPLEGAILAAVTTLPAFIICSFRSMSYTAMSTILDRAIAWLNEYLSGLYAWFVKARK